METKNGRQVLCRMFFNPRVLCTSILTHSFFITAATQNAIEVAAQCVDQAFSCASQNLDSVGLPLTPRLAEYIRYVRYTLFPKKKVAVKDRVKMLLNYSYFVLNILDLVSRDAKGKSRHCLVTDGVTLR